VNLRERVLASVDGKEVYPVPIDVAQNIIYPGLENRLMERLGVNDRENLFRALGAHMRWANPRYIGPPLEKLPNGLDVDPFPAKYAYKDIWGAYPGLMTYSDGIVQRTFAKADSVKDIENHSWPNSDWYDYGMVAPPLAEDEDYVPIIQWAQENVHYARVIGGYNPIFGLICDLCGIETALMHLVARPDLVHTLVQRITKFLVSYYEGIAKAGEGYIDILAFGDDFASQRGMMFSPQQWRDYFKSAWTCLFGIAHKYNMKAMFHSCGAIRLVIGDLMDAGMDIFEIVQIRAKGMDPIELKKEFGSSLTFYGTVDVQGVLRNYPPDEVRKEIRRLIDIFGPGGRYILTTCHLLMEDIPVENVLAMYEEARAYVPRKGN
jgi:uroporphyrinogen decarboxylase